MPSGQRDSKYIQYNDEIELLYSKFGKKSSVSDTLIRKNATGNLPDPGDHNIAARVIYAQALVKYAAE